MEILPSCEESDTPVCDTALRVRQSPPCPDPERRERRDGERGERESCVLSLVRVETLSVRAETLLEC